MDRQSLGLSRHAQANGNLEQSQGASSAQEPEPEPEPEVVEQEPRPKRRKRALVTNATLRTAIACRTCRERKSRCSGDQPSCSYCSKTGIQCEYTSGVVAVPPPVQPSRSLDEWGDKILAAVDSLAQEMRVGARNNPSQSPREFHPLEAVRRAQFFEAGVAEDNTGLDDTGEDYTWTRSSKVPLPGPSPVAGGFSVLAWTIFSNLERPAARIKSALFTSIKQYNSSKHAFESASCATSDLLGLLSSFAEFLLPTIPVIDLAQVRRITRDIGEYGISWTGESCLVLLIAALGSIYQTSNRATRQPQDTPQESSPASSRLSCANTSERLTSGTLRYWNMARKRLSWATNATGLLAAQCQLLAGVYLLYSSETAASWKMLTGALMSIDDEQLCDTSVAEKNLLLVQNTRLATVTIISHLRCEVESSFSPGYFELPLDAYSYDQMTMQNSPLPILDKAAAEILHIRARACAGSALISPDMPIKDICSLLKKLSSSLSALSCWHSSLPPWSSFPLATGVDVPDLSTSDSDSRLQMQELYYETEELILRPALFLLIHSQPIQEALLALQAGGEREGIFEHMLSMHVATQLREMSQRHRACLIVRSRLCLNPILTRPRISEIGWLKRQTCFTLALLLIASSRTDDHAAGLMHVDDSVVAIDQAIDFLANDVLCSEASKVSAAILRSYRSPDANGEAFFSSTVYR